MTHETLVHGTAGLWCSYAAVQVPLLAGLYGAASLRKLLSSLLAAPPLTVATGLGAATVAPWLRNLGPKVRCRP